MPGLWHDSGNELFRDDPDFAGRLVRLAGVDLLPGVRLVPAPTNETDRMLSNDLDPTGRTRGSSTPSRPESCL